jgi:hypothetical protein
MNTPLVLELFLMVRPKRGDCSKAVSECVATSYDLMV